MFVLLWRVGLHLPFPLRLQRTTNMVLFLAKHGAMLSSQDIFFT